MTRSAPCTVYVHSPNHNDRGGSMQHYARELSNLFAAHGYDVVFCSSRRFPLGHRSVSVPAPLLTRINRLNMLLLYVAMCWDIVRRRPDQFCVLNISHEFIFPLFLRHALVIIHDTIQMEYPRSRAVKLLLGASWFLARRAGKCICVSKATQSDLARLNIVADVIYVPFDAAQTARIAAARSKDDPARFDAVWCGTLAVHKNVDLYLRLARDNPDRSFAAMVPRQEAEPLAARAPANVTVLTSLSPGEYFRTLADARMCVSTSLKEGYGMPPMEALMLGTPALLSDISVYRELYGEVATFFSLDTAALGRQFHAVLAGTAVPPIPHPSAGDLSPFQGRAEQFLAPVAAVCRG